MNQSIQKLERLLAETERYMSSCTPEDLSKKPAPNKWSKREILGHLIDSAINNLQRFTEIQYAEKPYLIRNYRQDDLVLVNDYQHAELQELLTLWKALNRRIGILMAAQTESTLSYQIQFADYSTSDLKFLMTDYVEHMEHHILQIRRVH
ncbi:MAG: DinB family protein [Marinoscillum sp.]|uniref:DinB family protein n=1 Tax=Marinoscillum sp. TaxID=2024838 RepID=UPI0032F627F1